MRSYKLIVPEVSPSVMEGSNILERTLNAYITSYFVGSKNVPSGECLVEARHVIQILSSTLDHNECVEAINSYFDEKFNISSNDEIVNKIMDAWNKCGCGNPITDSEGHNCMVCDTCAGEILETFAMRM